MLSRKEITILLDIRPLPQQVMNSTRTEVMPQHILHQPLARRRSQASLEHTEGKALLLRLLDRTPGNSDSVAQFCTFWLNSLSINSLIYVILKIVTLLPCLSSMVNMKCEAWSFIFVYSHLQILISIQSSPLYLTGIVLKPCKARTCLVKATKPSEKFFLCFLICHLQRCVNPFGQKLSRKKRPPTWLTWCFIHFYALFWMIDFFVFEERL